MDPTAYCPGKLSRAFHCTLGAVFFSVLALTLKTQPARADSATWTGVLNNSWLNAQNWTPETIPTGPNDIATFGTSDETDISVHLVSEINTIVFKADASSYVYDLPVADFSFSGQGISNNSAKLQTFVCHSVCYSCGSGYPTTFNFYNSATTGDSTQFTVEAALQDEAFGGELYFWDSSTAGSASINNLGSNFYYGGGATYFEDDSSAENAVIINQGSGGHGHYSYGSVTFDDGSSAGHAIIINNGPRSSDGAGGRVVFNASSDSGDSTITCDGTANGGYAPPILDLHGEFGVGVQGRARVILLGTGELDVSGVFDEEPVTIGSIEGDGNVFLGLDPTQLKIGTNNLSTIFSGIIHDNPSAAGGSLLKVGNGKLTLSNANSYTGKTIVDSGTLLINNIVGSGTGSGMVHVRGGILGGDGIIAGAVIIGRGDGSGAVIGPGRNSVIPGTLTIKKGLTLHADGTYRVTINSDISAADQLAVNGLRLRGAQILLYDGGSAVLTPGAVFTIINNTAETPISGTFANLPDAGSVTVGVNTFQASYEGGDGNDLTLTVASE